jgi:hypothetical protein
MGEEKKEDTKDCPVCAEVIKLEARICRLCGARFQVTKKGYCSNCHDEVEVDENNNCKTCGKPVLDVRVTSSLTDGARLGGVGAGSVAASAATPVTPAAPLAGQVPYYTPPGAGAPSQQIAGRRTATPIIFGVLHLALAGYFVWFMVNNGFDFRAYDSVFMPFVMLIGAIVLPIAAILLFTKSKIGYVITFVFGIISAAFLIYYIIISFQYFDRVPGTVIIAFFVVNILRFGYPMMAANTLRQNMRVGLK